ncbi:50S ribosomal protein L28 [Streptomyces sp. ITFR-6]|uniref:50S ribosomal protein L28 n=1 Tax=Streptomyces sp. ITFR-6 TaxID=3075197 RepID=UPI0037D9E3E4
MRNRSSRRRCLVTRRLDPDPRSRRCRHVRLGLSARAVKTADVVGVGAAVARTRAHGGRFRCRGSPCSRFAG